MPTILDNGLIWWITVIELPVFTGLIWLVHKNKRESDRLCDKLQDNLDVRTHQLRDALAAFKLEAAKSYASFADLKDLETRLVAHLLRIESKLDRTALKAEALESRDK